MARVDHELNDDTLQSLFAASVLLHSAGANPPEVAARLAEADQALDRAIQQLRDHLVSHPPPK